MCICVSTYCTNGFVLLLKSSEGIQVEYIAVFFAVLFPGALVAFNQELLQSLPRFNVLRVYCAGIWHNAAVRSSLKIPTKCLFHLYLLNLTLVLVVAPGIIFVPFQKINNSVNADFIFFLVLCSLWIALISHALDLVSLLQTW